MPCPRLSHQSTGLVSVVADGVGAEAASMGQHRPGPDMATAGASLGLVQTTLLSDGHSRSVSASQVRRVISFWLAIKYVISFLQCFKVESVHAVGHPHIFHYHDGISCE